MTLVPTLMALRFEDVIVQKPPARRVYCEHSFVTWSAPLRGELPPSLSSAAFREADTNALALGPLASLPLQPPATSIANTGKANRYVILSLHGDSQPGTHRA